MFGSATKRTTILLAVAVSQLAAADPVPASVAAMWKVFADLRTAHARHKEQPFRLSETEVNAYLGDLLRYKPRPGLKTLHVKLFTGNYVSTYTILNFEDIEKARPGTVPALLKPLLTGDQKIWVDLRFRADSSLGTFSIEKAYLGDLRLPALLVEKVIEVIAARQPEKFDTTKPVPLPFGLRSVNTGPQVIRGTT